MCVILLDVQLYVAQGGEPEVIRGIVNGLSSSMRRLMESKPEEARRELETVAGLMVEWLELAKDEEKRHLVEANGRRTRETLESL